MILSFKQQFVDPILNGHKVHTIRADQGRRWRQGMTIHFATSARTPQYRQFHEAICTAVQDVSILYENQYPSIYVDGKCIRSSETQIAFAINDGFAEIGDFYKFFDRNFAGRLIHWSNPLPFNGYDG